MESNFENKTSMFFTIREYFSNKLTALAVTAPILTTLVGTFNTRLDELAALTTTAEQDNSGNATQKQNLRNDMSDKVLRYGGGLYAYYMVNNNPVTAAKVYTTISTLNGKRDTAVLYYADRMFGIADDLLSGGDDEILVPYGITAAQIAGLGTAITAYRGVIQDPTDQRSLSKAARAEALKKIEPIDNTLFIIDNVMLGISEQHPLDYGQYKNDRFIVDNAAGHGTPDVIEVIEANTIETIYEMQYLVSRSFKLNNKSDVELQWALSENGTDPINDEWQTIPANSISTLQSTTLGENGDLLIINNQTDTDATVELHIV